MSSLLILLSILAIGANIMNANNNTEEGEITNNIVEEEEITDSFLDEVIEKNKDNIPDVDKRILLMSNEAIVKDLNEIEDEKIVNEKVEEKTINEIVVPNIKFIKI